MCFPQRASQKEQNKIAKILSVHTVHKTRRSQSKATQPRPILPKKLQTFICKYSPQKAGEGEDRRKTRKSQCKALQPCFIMTMWGLRVLAQDHPRWKKKKKSLTWSLSCHSSSLTDFDLYRTIQDVAVSFMLLAHHGDTDGGISHTHALHALCNTFTTLSTTLQKQTTTSSCKYSPI